jgi:hypothetical protein
MADVLVYPAMEAMDGPLAPGASHAAPYPPDQSAPQIKAFSPRYKVGPPARARGTAPCSRPGLPGRAGGRGEGGRG